MGIFNKKVKGHGPLLGLIPVCSIQLWILLGSETIFYQGAQNIVSMLNAEDSTLIQSLKLGIDSVLKA